MVAVRVVKGVADEEVGVVAVGNGFVPAAGRMPAVALDRGAGARTAAVHFEPVLVRVPLVRRVQVPVVQVVRVVAMPHLTVPATGAVHVVVVAVLAAGHLCAGGIVSLERNGVNPRQCRGCSGSRPPSASS